MNRKLATAYIGHINAVTCEQEGRRNGCVIAIPIISILIHVINTITISAFYFAAVLKKIHTKQEPLGSKILK